MNVSKLVYLLLTIDLSILMRCNIKVSSLLITLGYIILSPLPLKLYTIMIFLHFLSFNSIILHLITFVPIIIRLFKLIPKFNTILSIILLLFILINFPHSFVILMDLIHLNMLSKNTYLIINWNLNFLYWFISHSLVIHYVILLSSII